MYKQRPIKLLYGLSSCISWPRSKLLTNAINTPPSNDARAITGCLSSEETAQQNNWAVGSTDESRFANFCSSLPWRGSQNLKIRKHCLRIQDHYHSRTSCASFIRWQTCIFCKFLKIWKNINLISFPQRHNSSHHKKLCIQSKCCWIQSTPS